MDPENPVVKLCVAGMKAEGENDFESARRQFERAWEAASDDFERCIAAHYVARHQPTPADALSWNREAMRFAELVGDDRVSGFLPSLLLNLGQSYEALGDSEEAKRYYERASAQAEALPIDRYGNLVRDGAAAGRARVAEEEH